jgi:hypothetical protein
MQLLLAIYVILPLEKVERVSIFYLECGALRGYHSLYGFQLLTESLYNVFSLFYLHSFVWLVPDICLLYFREVLWRFFGGTVSFSFDNLNEFSQQFYVAGVCVFNKSCAVT